MSRAQALLAAARGEPEDVESNLRVAVDGLAALDYPYWLARGRTDLAAWLIEDGRSEEAALPLDEAAAALEELGAEPALARAQQLIAAAANPPDTLSATG